MDKIFVVSGDLQYKGLQLDDDDRELLIKEVNIVFHSAAVVSFKKTLKEMIHTNVRGTKELLEMCEKIKNLDSVVVISTAYSFCPKKKIDECFLEPPVKPDTILKIIDEFTEDSLIKITPILIGDWPNAYSFSKAIMEDVVKSKVGKLPIGLIRPSVVLPTYKDPIRNWGDNLNGSVGLTVGVGLGIIRVSWCEGAVRNDLVPGDYVINSCIAAGCHLHNRYQLEKIPKNIVFNYVTTTKYSLSLKDNIALCMKNFVPSSRQMWVPSIYLIANPIVYFMLDIFLHRIPAAFLDALRIIRRKKPFFWKLYSRILLETSLINYFVSQEWDWKHDNLNDLWDNLSPKDKEILPFDLRSLDWDDYYKDYPKGIMQYVLKEKMDEESRRKATKRYQRLQKLHYTFLAVLFSFVAVFILIMMKRVF